jgi:hypothetical protein
MVTSDRQKEFALNISKLIQHIFDSGCSCTLGEAYRTADQAALYARDGKGILNSQHRDRLAMDINLFSKDGKYEKKTESYSYFGKYWESLHPDNRWGGRYSDGNHFEMKD